MKNIVKENKISLLELAKTDLPPILSAKFDIALNIFDNGGFIVVSDDTELLPDLTTSEWNSVKGYLKDSYIYNENIWSDKKGMNVYGRDIRKEDK